MRIHVLDALLSNQIAAGEVIERPSSVVKELIENSLDAGADRVVVEIEQGGQSLIKIKDNGHGVHPDDLTLALERHATSKIASYDDLTQVMTLGFRGEALASIAAVSRLKMISATPDTQSGWMIKNTANGMIETPVPIAHPIGTTVEVADLFYHTPARKKFLRAERTEFQHIESMLHRMILSRSDVYFQLLHNGREIFSVMPAHNQVEYERRVSVVCGNEFVSQALHITYENHTMTLSGWISEPRFSRAQSDMQYVYLNGRFVRDKTILHAIREAYRDVLFHGRHPAYVLHLTMDPEGVDVNVHPTKQEVRFKDTQSIFSFVRRGVSEALSGVRPGAITASVILPESSHCHDDHATPHAHSHPVYSASAQKAMPLKVVEQMQVYRALHGDAAPVPEQLEMMPVEHQDCPLGFAVGQIHDTYLIAQNAAGMVMVDMHAAHERILYEKMKANSSEVKAAMQQLLLPIILELQSNEMHAFENHQLFFAQIGFEMELIGQNQLIIRAVPALIQHKNMQMLFRDIFSDLIATEKSTRYASTLDHVLSTVACHAALRSPHALNNAEINAILRDMERTENSGCCNHGRPTWKQFSKNELDRFFFRGQ